MPVTHLDLPRLATGLLQAQLLTHGHDCRVLYLHLEFARQLGVDEYELVDRERHSRHLGEWLFSEAVYGDRAASIDEYCVAAGKKAPPAELTRKRLSRWRAAASGFVARMAGEFPWDQYDFVGFSLLHQQTHASLALARSIKERLPAMPILFGGACCQGGMGPALLESFAWLDGVCTGEGEQVILDVCDALDDPGALSRIPGLVWRGSQPGDGEARKEPQSCAAIDLADVPAPTYQDYFAQLEECGLLGKVWKPGVVVAASRGCSWGERSPCRFCGLSAPWARYRTKPIDTAAQEVRAILAAHPLADYCCFADRVVPTRFLREAVPGLLADHRQTHFFFELRADLDRDDIASLVSEAAVTVQLGVESFNDDILALIGKGVTALQNIQTLRWLSEIGVRVRYNILYGFPMEPRHAHARVEEEWQRLWHLPPPEEVRQFRLEQFSPFFEQAAEYGLRGVRPTAMARTVYRLLPHQVAAVTRVFDFDLGAVQPAETATRLEDARRAWRDANAVFVAARCRDGLVFIDNRGLRGPESSVLTGLDARIIDACDGIMLRSALQAALAVPEDRLGPAIERLTREGFLCCRADQLLSLAIRLDRYLPRADLEPEAALAIMAPQPQTRARQDSRR